MTRKQVRRLAESRVARSDPEWKKAYRVRARRRAGRCVVTVTQRRSNKSIKLASAATWAAAGRQVHP